MAFQQEGPDPTVRRTAETEVASAVLDEIKRLQTAYPRGTLAVIGHDLTDVQVQLRRDGWQAWGTTATEWRNDRGGVSLLHHDLARGLEFDAVVVVEPAAFPKNIGRHGPLYTALTRPNRELSIVHSQPLPDELRARRLARSSASTTLDQEITRMEEEVLDGVLLGVKAADQIRIARESIRIAKVADHEREALLERLGALSQLVDEHRAAARAEKQRKQLETLQAKTSLVIEAEQLASVHDWQTAQRRMRILLSRWSRLPHLSRATDDKLWSRVMAAQEAVSEQRRRAIAADRARASAKAPPNATRPAQPRTMKKQQTSSGRAPAKKTALDRKRSIVSEAEHLARSSTDWARVTKRFEKLESRWAATPRLDKATEKVLRDRFRRARATYNHRRRNAATMPPAPAKRAPAQTDRGVSVWRPGAQHKPRLGRAAAAPKNGSS